MERRIVSDSRRESRVWTPDDSGDFDFSSYGNHFFRRSLAADLVPAGGSAPASDGQDIERWNGLGSAVITQTNTVLDPNFINEASGVDFVGSPERMDVSSLPTLSDDFVFIARIDLDAVTVINYAFDMNGGTDRVICCLAVSPANLGFFDTALRNSGVAPNTGDHVWAWRYRAGANSAIWEDGTLVSGTISVAASPRSMGTSGMLMASATTGGYVNGKLKAFGLWPDLTDAQVVEISNAMAAL